MVKNLERVQNISRLVKADSYKAGHYAMYPDAKKMVAYGEFRKPFPDTEDDRILWYGIRYLVEEYLLNPITQEDLDEAEWFYNTHNAGNTQYPFPKHVFQDIIDNHGGYLPIKLETLPEGSVVGPHTPVYQITAEGKYARLVTFLETALTRVWYPTSVATLSRLAWDHIHQAFQKSVDLKDAWLLNSRLHDFGYRGVSSEESAVLGGMAHLVNFEGTDTMSAAFYAQKYYNGGKPVATSIPATEHSVMMSWKTESDAIGNMVEVFGKSIFACVMDTYDYDNAINNVVKEHVAELKRKGGLIVLRPDSGDPVRQVLAALEAAEKNFGAVVNQKGYKVITGAAVIQGDGMDLYMIRDLYDAVLAAGYSAQNVAVGMGGGLLQKVNRDTLSFATKLSYIEYPDGTSRDVMKMPTTDKSKYSFPGELVVRNIGGVRCADSKDLEWEDGKSELNQFETVYDCGPIGYEWANFTEVRKRATEEWLTTPRSMVCVSAKLRGEIEYNLQKAGRL